jgi:HEAT repeat protein
MKNDPIQLALGRLDEIELQTPEGRKQIAKALAAKSNLVAAKAARIAGYARMSELKDDLAAAFHRFLARGAEVDKGCQALTAIARALFALDYDEYELYLAGMRHIQKEASFGPPVDTAVELRAVCAMGLAGSRYRQKLHALVDLLVDPEWQARAGAVRAVAAIGSEPAALLLRLKALSGDEETEVTADCLAGLLSVEGTEALPLVRNFAVSGDSALSEAALLALGSSRRPEAVEWLKTRFAEVASTAARKCILLALATSRTEDAIAFLLRVIREESEHASSAAVAAMEIHRDERLRGLMQEAVRARLAAGR